MDDEFSATHQLQNGEVILICVADEGETISFFSQDNVKIGEFELEPDDNGNFRLVRMFLDEVSSTYTRQGLGEASLRLHRDIFQSKVFATPSDGAVRLDGSHLTGNAPAFVEKMTRLGLIDSVWRHE